jgi:hypothetical protein
LVAIQNKWFPWKSVLAMKFNDRFSCCYGKLIFAMEVTGCFKTLVCYEKSMADMKSLVAMETKL